MEIKVMDKVLAANDAWAEENREFLADKNIVMFNFIGSPGAGKTALLEMTIKKLGGTIAMGVIEGDIATTKDAQRIKNAGVPVFQINTGNACHLDAHLVNIALKELLKDSPDLRLVCVENIGNLVCPAEFDIGEAAKIGVLSVTEGDDKVEKYPLLFSEAKSLVITKSSFLSLSDFNMAHVTKAFRNLNKNAPVFQVDSVSGDGYDTWVDWITKYTK